MFLGSLGLSANGISREHALKAPGWQHRLHSQMFERSSFRLSSTLEYLAHRFFQRLVICRWTATIEEQ